MPMREVVEQLEAVEFEQHASGTAVATDADVGAGTFLGRRATIYPGVALGAGCIVLDGAVLGRMPIPNPTTTRPVDASFGHLTIGDGSIVGANAVLYTGSTFGRQVLIGDLTSVREGCKVGDGAILGRAVMALYNCSIGAFSRIQDQVHLVGEAPARRTSRSEGRRSAATRWSARAARSSPTSRSARAPSSPRVQS
jgi:UDP-3-O-[3-hydroxymyristoyl] glucosamine N-acyltransferase